MKRLICALLLAILLAPLPSDAQTPPKVFRVVYLQVMPWSPENVYLLDAFRQGLRELGWVHGQNVIIESRHADGREERLPAVAAELVGRK